MAAGVTPMDVRRAATSSEVCSGGEADSTVQAKYED